MKEKVKMVQVREDTHKKLKVKASENGMSIKDYVEYLLELDINKELK